MRSSDIPLSRSRVVNSLEPYPITRSSVPMFHRTLHLYPGKIIHLSGHVMRNKPMNFIKISDRLAPGFPGQRLRNFKKTNRQSVVLGDWIEDPSWKNNLNNRHEGSRVAIRVPLVSSLAREFLPLLLPRCIMDPRSIPSIRKIVLNLTDKGTSLKRKIVYFTIEE